MKYTCQVCGYVYDEEVEKVLFETLPEDWECPLCRAPKSEFLPQEEKKVEESSVSKPVPTNHSEVNTDLSYGQMAALCANLSRACEKQYKNEEASLFAKLEDYFVKHTEPKQGSLDDLLEMIKKDIDQYSVIREVADQYHDRGTARALVWGEKVTRILSSLLLQYEKHGEHLLDQQEVWVCSACGFVFVGEEAPELCPVCKVPSWKFEKVTGREG